MNQESAVNLSRQYIDLLRKSEVDRAFLLAHLEAIPRDKFGTLLDNANRDVDNARFRLQNMSKYIQAPEIPIVTKIDVAGNIKAPEQEADFSLKWLGVAVAGLVAVPFIMKVVADNPGATRQLIRQLALLFHSDQV